MNKYWICAGKSTTSLFKMGFFFFFFFLHLIFILFLSFGIRIYYLCVSLNLSSNYTHPVHSISSTKSLEYHKVIPIIWLSVITCQYMVYTYLVTHISREKKKKKKHRTILCKMHIFSSINNLQCQSSRYEDIEIRH